VNLKPSFEIQPLHADTSVSNLFIELGPHGLSYIIIDAENKCTALACYHFPSEDTLAVTEHIRNIVEEKSLLRQPYGKVHVIYSYPYSVMVPGAMMKHELKKEMLEMVFGDMNAFVMRNDFMYRHNIYNLYATPRETDAELMYIFSADSVVHQFSLLPDMVKEKENAIYCIFNSRHFTVMLSKDGKMQLVQAFSYKTPEDVAYYLLHVCQSFDVAPAAVKILLNGMIDASSALYTEIEKYFLHLRFGELPEMFTYPAEIKEYPSHFFNHLFLQASCVS
jgi:hypothetical protein